MSETGLWAGAADGTAAAVVPVAAATACAQTSEPFVRALLARTLPDCPDEVLARIQQGGILRHYAHGQYVTRRDTPSNRTHFVVQGELESSVTYASGHRHLFAFSRQGDWIGILYLMASGNHLFDHIARGPTTLLAIPNEVLMREMQTEPSVCLALLRRLSLRAEIKYRRVTLDPGVPLLKRLAWALQMMGELYGHARGSTIELGVRLSQSDIADWLGVSRQHLSPHLKQLEKNGVIGLGRASVSILDGERLRQLSGD